MTAAWKPTFNIRHYFVDNCKNTELVCVMGLSLYAVVLFSFWLVITGTTDLWALLTGAILTGIAVLLFRSALRGQWISESPTWRPVEGWGRRAIRLVLFVPLFSWKVLSSGIGIARLALTPGVTFWPGIVRTSSNLPGIGSTTALANLITLTPGTLTLDYSVDDDMLYIHWIDVSEYAAEDIDSEVTSNMRPWIKEITG